MSTQGVYHLNRQRDKGNNHFTDEEWKWSLRLDLKTGYLFKRYVLAQLQVMGLMREAFTKMECLCYGGVLTRRSYSYLAITSINIRLLVNLLSESVDFILADLVTKDICKGGELSLIKMRASYFKIHTSS